MLQNGRHLPGVSDWQTHFCSVTYRSWSRAGKISAGWLVGWLVGESRSHSVLCLDKFRVFRVVTWFTLHDCWWREGHTLQDFWPGGIPEKCGLVSKPRFITEKHVRSEREMLLPHLHQSFLPWPGSRQCAGLLYHTEMLPQDEITCIHR